MDGCTTPPPPRAIEIVEVAPRDGLQNEARHFTTAEKIALIERSVAAGIRRIEVASFVRPDRVPQMADAEAVIASLPDWPGVVTIALVLNAKGAERALATRVGELGAVCVATDSFAMRNQNQTARGSVDVAAEIVRLARREGRRAQITIGAAFGCPFEGRVDPARVVELATIAAQAGPIEIGLADTIGVAVPGEVTALVAAVRAAIAPIPVRVHFHDTRGTAIANVWAACLAGATVVDGALGGIGGCPFAPGATGNVATEDVLYLLQRSGVDTGVDLSRLVDASGWLAGVMARPLPGALAAAGNFSTLHRDFRGD